MYFLRDYFGLACTNSVEDARADESRNRRRLVALMKEQRPSLVTSPHVEQRAARIMDPVERLRYLRVEAVRAGEKADRKDDGRKMWRHWTRMVIIVLCSGMAVLPLRQSTLASADRIHDTAPRLQVQDAAVPKVWLVDQTATYENYSNGLRIETQWAVANVPRTRYRVFQRERPRFDHFEWRTGVAGIVYHTTESHVAAFEPGTTVRQKQVSAWAISDIQKRRCYNYVIDRYGRVWRVVNEDSIAWHAGRSVWGDEGGTYVDVNDSFLAVSFEAQTYDESQSTATPAQIRAARALTEMLRSKYKIAASNCVTHAQVSVSAQHMKIGLHTDWASNFPFADMGLKDNYALPMAAVWAFGFDYDPTFVQATGNRLWQGLIYADQHLHEQASLAGMTVPQYKQLLQQRYKELITALYSADEESNNEIN
jgi:N-acetylmuramoyl-L-alanine amidase